jgi:cellobiose-specific phosphotransferase system component IIA
MGRSKAIVMHAMKPLGLINEDDGDELNLSFIMLHYEKHLITLIL